MNKTSFIFAPLIFTFLLSGCSTMVVKEDNSVTFETWELCTLLYRPNQMYSDWFVDNDENNNIKRELQKRGVFDKKECEVVELAKRQCGEFGYKENTEKFIDCTANEFKNINNKVFARKQNKERTDEAQAQSFIDGWNSGLKLYPQPLYTVPSWQTYTPGF